MTAKLKDTLNSPEQAANPKGAAAEYQPKPLTIGDPACPYCHGLGFTREDLPVNDPNYGKLHVCVCRADDAVQENFSGLVEKSNLGPLRQLTFQSFQPRGRVGLARHLADSLEQAYQSAQTYAGTLNGWLLLLGRYGSGKTHLAAAIANQALSMGVRTLFLTVPDLLDWLRFSYNATHGESFEERFEEIRNIPLLIMDDFGTQNATAWAQEKLFQILNQRYAEKLPTVITSNNDLQDFEGRIRSRLLDPHVVTRITLTAPDYRDPTDDLGHPELSYLSLHHKLRFENFELRQGEGLKKEERDSLKSALQSAQDFAQNPQGWLYLTGPNGSGKTHLAAAIGNYRAQLGYPPLMVGVPDLLDHLRATFAPGSAVNLDRRFDEIRSAPLLILDDLGTESATPWAREKLYQLFNYRYITELPTVITSDKLPNELESRLESRLIDERLCRILIVGVPAYRGRGLPRKQNRPIV